METDHGLHNGEEVNQPFPDLNQPPERVVSLVPSITESFFELGLGGTIVGVTDYCTRPEEALRGMPRVGGIRGTRVDDILALHPDLVIANQEENLPETVSSLEKAGIRVWVTFPRSVVHCIEMLWAIAGMFQSEPARRKVEVIQTALDWQISASESEEPVRYFCPLWQAQTDDGSPWWMTCNQDTYTSDLLKILGGENVFAARERVYPLDANLGVTQPEATAGRDTRYPVVTQADILKAAPEVILLPDEPFDYRENHIQRLAELFNKTPAVQTGAIRLVDGSMITWYGTRLAYAITELSGLFTA